MKNRGFTLVELLVVLLVAVVGIAILFGIVGGAAYKYLYAENVTAKVTEIQNIQPSAVVADAGVVFSSALMLTTKEGQMISTSSEDRQWFVVKQGQCVRAKLFKYAPWDLDKAGTYYGARMISIIPCWE